MGEKNEKLKEKDENVSFLLDSLRYLLLGMPLKHFRNYKANGGKI